LNQNCKQVFRKYKCKNEKRIIIHLLPDIFIRGSISGDMPTSKCNRISQSSRLEIHSERRSYLLHSGIGKQQPVGKRNNQL
jgi:hypothetical protein